MGFARFIPKLSSLSHLNLPASLFRHPAAFTNYPTAPSILACLSATSAYVTVPRGAVNTQGRGAAQACPYPAIASVADPRPPHQIYHLGANNCSGLLPPATDYPLNAQPPAYG